MSDYEKEKIICEVCNNSIYVDRKMFDVSTSGMIYRDSNEYLLRQNKKLKEENKLLRECVEFYARDSQKEYGYTALDNGKLGRETLAKIKGEENE